MKLFLDTNILIDLAADRKPFSKWAFQIFRESKAGRWTLYTSSSSILTTYYIIEKNIGTKKAKQTIKILLKRIEIIPIDKLQLQSALMTSFEDYEDGVQHECAKALGDIDFIVTRNTKDFRTSIITIASPEELCIPE